MAVSLWVHMAVRVKLQSSEDGEIPVKGNHLKQQLIMWIRVIMYSFYTFVLLCDNMKHWTEHGGCSVISD